MLGLETALALALTHLDLPVEQVLALLSWRPAAILGVGDAHGGPGRRGAARPTCAWSTRRPTWTVDPSALASRSRNTPYAGMALTGPGPPHAAGGGAVVVDAEAQR